MSPHKLVVSVRRGGYYPPAMRRPTTAPGDAGNPSVSLPGGTQAAPTVWDEGSPKNEKISRSHRRGDLWSPAGRNSRFAGCVRKSHCFQPGDHATTFGGTPIATAAGVAACSILLEDEFLANVQETGEYFRAELRAIGERQPGKIKEVRGLGLMIGCELTGSAKDVNAELFKNGVLVNTIGEHVLRFVPPLTITKEQIDDFITILENALAK